MQLKWGVYILFSYLSVCIYTLLSLASSPGPTQLSVLWHAATSKAGCDLETFQHVATLRLGDEAMILFQVFYHSNL